MMKTSSKYVKYQLGAVVAIPLTISGYILEVIVRANLRAYSGGGVIAYVFDKRYKEVPLKIDYDCLCPLKARTFIKHSDLEIRNGRWPVIGQIPNFDPSLWIMPHFHQHTTGFGSIHSKAVVYDEKKPLEVVRQYDVHPDVALRDDCLYGHSVLIEEIEEMIKQKKKYPYYSLRLPHDPELLHVIRHYSEDNHGDLKNSGQSGDGKTRGHHRMALK